MSSVGTIKIQMALDPLEVAFVEESGGNRKPNVCKSAMLSESMFAVSSEPWLTFTDFPLISVTEICDGAVTVINIVPLAESTTTFSRLWDCDRVIACPRLIVTMLLVNVHPAKK